MRDDTVYDPLVVRIIEFKHLTVKTTGKESIIIGLVNPKERRMKDVVHPSLSQA